MAFPTFLSSSAFPSHFTSTGLPSFPKAIVAIHLSFVQQKMLEKMNNFLC